MSGGRGGKEEGRKIRKTTIIGQGEITDDLYVAYSVTTGGSSSKNKKAGGKGRLQKSKMGFGSTPASEPGILEKGLERQSTGRRDPTRRKIDRKGKRGTASTSPAAGGEANHPELTRKRRKSLGCQGKKVGA